ncbi:UDP-N-acetylmuramoyl-tripeptide--D-alanyl-D-alanine ligase [Aquicoccus porphyridii]|uniref:Glutamate ligase n=1 Tax=Aquicoccus porphyridii TaxID=1852029 RepID=A0A5A9Z731_9RHOB|nr:UDP-N-acetylmuramoyl-tripeptide--D-alanyl-D-alanine ligase [Aquicoccus porphyridii]KAA0912993.1 glutamate ligase [Aquicoccus porphyridii]RAI54270.1 glutamate ligase [Rhodobacteraceae bacterium AsT-22]
MNDAATSQILDEILPRISSLPDPYPRYVVFVSATDGDNRARVKTITASSLIGLREGLQEKELAQLLSARHVRLDWVTSVQVISFAAYKAALQKVKRNYSRKGVSLDADFRHAVTEGELNGSALFYKGAQVPHCEINLNNFGVYWKRRFGQTFEPPENSDTVYLFTSDGLFSDRDNGELHTLMPSGLNGGRRVFDLNQAGNLDFLILESATYLAAQVNENGMFHYGRYPCFDRPINHYNTLRHASSTYALCEAYELIQSDDIRVAIERSLKRIAKYLVKYSNGPAGASAYLMDTGKEVKLGGNAVAILAYCKFSEVTGDKSVLELARRLGNGILSMQQENGGFCHILDADSLTPKEDFRTIYYDGEAAFGLMRLYGATGEKRWLDAARRAVDHFISKDYWQYNDHWLAYCVNELSCYHSDPEYVSFGVRNVRDYLPFIRDRITTFPTLLELCCATRLLVQRSLQDPSLVPVVDALDLSAFREAMEHRAQYLTNGFFFPEVAMYFRNPASVTGSFFIRHHGFRVRIDDVEHYLSGLIAYRSYLKERDSFIDCCEQQKRRLADRARQARWSSTDITSLLEGAEWLRPPTSALELNGVSTYAPSFREDDIVFARHPDDRFGIPYEELEENQIIPRLAIVSNDGGVSVKADSVLRVPDMRAALIALAKDARKSLTGPVVGVTGSAGKTSVTAMIAHCLGGVGKVHSTRFSANMVRGLAWNLCCAPVDTEYCVLEMAIGQMQENTRLARPDIALFTNIHPAHLIHHKDTATIARRKAHIFSAMPDDGVAILNRNMNEYEIVEAAAKDKGLRVVTYGWSDASDIFPIVSTPSAQEVTLEAFGKRHVVPIVGAGSYAVENTMAVVAVISVLRQPIEPVLKRLTTFARDIGRGQIIELATPGTPARIIDHSYNANPASMRAALDEMFAMPCSGKRVAILGDMAELGEESQSEHTELLKFLEEKPLESVYLVGDEFKASISAVGDDGRFRTTDLGDLENILTQQVSPGDVILVKGSNSTGLFQHLEKFRTS